MNAGREGRIGRRTSRAGRMALLGVAGLAAAAALAPVATAHPLGNFTINHFAAIRVAPDRISLDVVIDRAEVPAFQEVQRLDADGDGSLGSAELAMERTAACERLSGDISLAVDGRPVSPRLVAAGLSTPPGAGGLPTMRLVCELEAALPAPLAGPSMIEFEDRSFAERIGWREIVVVGDRVTVAGGEPGVAVSATGVTNRLTAYPDDLLQRPLDQRVVRVEVTPGGPALAPWSAPDAVALDRQGMAGSAGLAGAVPGGVPGGIGEELAALVDIDDPSPLAILVALAVALALGVVHAVSPGHGKTIMAAYLVGGRGSTRQAVGLGLAVAVSHTLGVLALAGITLAASSALPPERLYPILGLISGGLVVAIGATLLWSRIRALRGSGNGHGHEHPHPHPHRHGDQNGHDDHEHGHGHGHAHDHHPASASTPISWRGLVALGLSGGMVPSASALILLLGSIAVGQPAYGLVLVAAFGTGMAVVLGGLGLLLVHAHRLVDRRPSMRRLGALVAPAQLASASLVVVLGVILTGQALTQVR